MDTRKPTASQPLWLIAFLLFIIAGCLVMLVVQQRAMVRRESPKVVSVPEPQSSTTKPKFTPAFSRPTAEPDRNARRELHPRNVVQTEPAETHQFGQQSSPEVIPIVAREPEPVTPGGIAPLAIAPTNVVPKTNGVGTGIFGRVILKGRPPKETVISHDAVCGRVHLKQTTTRFYEVSPDGGLANVFVWISGGLKPQKFAPPAPALLSQVECQFQPYVMGLMPRQELVVTNADSIFHNIDAMDRSHGLDGNVTLFNKADSPYKTVSWGYDDSADHNHGGMYPIRIKCDVHPWMNAYVCEVGNPFFAITDSDGNFAITNVPAGNYELSIFHPHTHLQGEGFRSELKKIRITQGETTQADFVIQAKSR